MDEFERVVRTHSEVRRLSDAQLRDQVNVAFAARDHKRSLALYWEGWRRQDQGTRDREAPTEALFDDYEATHSDQEAEPGKGLPRRGKSATPIKAIKLEPEEECRLIKLARSGDNRATTRLWLGMNPVSPSPVPRRRRCL